MKHIRRYAAILAGLVGTVAVFGAGAPAAFAENVDPGGGGSPAGSTMTSTVVVGGMPGWQIALIAIGAALFAAAAAISADRAWRRRFAVMPA
jgi:hypothetical protein